MKIPTPSAAEARALRMLRALANPARFRTVGIYHEQGMLDGRWVDIIVMEKLLG